ncbi:hypothetical protein ACODM8_14245 [Vibrio ostreicida]|uniref:hypothetical protein n=1 Tax=Vibrio ostreicida TaxID=526588 RepID=UPI003B5CF528
MLHVTRILLINLFLFPLQVLAQQPVIYQLSVDHDDPDSVKVDVDTQSLGTIEFNPSRTRGHDTQPQLYCTESRDRTFSLSYGQAAQCQSVHWRLPLDNVTAEGLDIADQQDSRSVQKGWYFVSEWNSLPRIKQVEDVVVCGPDKRCQPIPKLSQAPAFVVWGMQDLSLDINGHTVRVYSDVDNVMHDLARWKPTFERQLSYLENVFSNPDRKQWQMAFFERKKRAGNLSGAAGNALILINTLTDNSGTLSEHSIQMLLKIAAHESVHIMDTASRPTWAAESLAEYYAMKSLQNTDYQTNDPLQEWVTLSKRFPFSDTGLIEANRRYEHQHQQQYYPLFYFKGAAFWFELDRQLVKKGTSLDSLMAGLMFKETGDLSDGFVATVVNQVGAQPWRNIEQAYLK